MLLSLLLIFELIQQAAVVNFMLFLNILKISKTHFEHFERKIDCLLPRRLLLRYNCKEKLE